MPQTYFLVSAKKTCFPRPTSFFSPDGSRAEQSVREIEEKRSVRERKEEEGRRAMRKLYLDRKEGRRLGRRRERQWKRKEEPEGGSR